MDAAEPERPAPQPNETRRMTENEKDSQTELTELPGTLPIMAGAQFVIYPFMIAPLVVKDEPMIRMIDDVVKGSRLIAIFAAREDAEDDGEHDKPLADRLHPVGTVALVLRMLKIPDGSLRMLIHGLRRIRLTGIAALEPYPVAEIEPLDDITVHDNETAALKKTARELLEKVIEQSSSLPGDLLLAAQHTEDPGRLADLIASNLSLHHAEQQAILELADTKKRLIKLQQIMSRELEIMKLGSKIQSQVKTNLDQVQRDFFLREQLKAIRHELGEEGDAGQELDELAAKIREAQMPEHAAGVANKELARLRSMSPASAEYTVSRTYLDWLIALPWSKHTADNIDLKKARAILDADHYDLEKIKERILEYLAVIKLRHDLKGSILCLAGPPGVGKTSLGRSIARAMGRQFVRISLGGVRDEAEIRGHRRTYIGAMPGRIVKSLKDAGSSNPVFMLDEIDKLGADFRGDPAAALLEVLDPEQNATFNDHYLDMPFDLSRVMFITTANTLETVPGPLRDRMEVLQLSGYTLNEKIQIAQRYLVPRAIANNGLKKGRIAFEDAALERIVEHYTREAGLRNLEREISSICRKVARRWAEGEKKPVRVDAAHVERALGPIRFDRELLDRRARLPGVSVGLAWTPFGGDILFIEATATAGQGRLILTGQLGDVMKESVQAARTWLHANARRLKLPAEMFTRRDLHLHVPAGAVPKDGPSAGTAMMAAMASLLLGRPIRDRLAMTGEITLKGSVLPVGGIKEKILAAHRSGVQTIILPSRNEKDLIDVPAEVREQLTLHFVDQAEQVIELAFARPAKKKKTAIQATDTRHKAAKGRRKGASQ
jgi:ATP-dependent Lon protease